MTPHDNNGVEREERLNAILASWLEAAETGQVPDEQEFLGRYPEFAPELTKHLANWKRFAPITDRPRPWVGAVAADTPPNGRASTLRPDGSATFSLKGEGRSFGGYELLEEIGRGGMGVVYKAWQKGPNRLVALKMVRPGLLMSEADAERFHNEGELVAQLDHPHVVPIYEVGQGRTDGGGPPVLYFSMKLMEGGSLAKEVASGQWPADSKERQRRAAQLLAAIAKAIHHAHQRGILHRDLKPSNILLDTEGRPHITDFGLGKRVPILGDHAAASLTETGAIVGTPPYMSPEQAAGKKGTITTATDVYGLGTILYALLTGRPPFQEDTPLETLVRLKECEPIRPSTFNPRVDFDLETICVKCLEKEPTRRYGSAEAFEEDLERWLAGKPIQARPVGRLNRTWRWIRRNPPLAAAVGLLLVTLLFASGAAAWGVWRYTADLKAAKEIAEDNGRETERQRKLALDNLRSVIADIDDLENRRPELDDVRQDLLIRVQKYLSAVLEDPSHDVQADEADFWLEIHVGDVFRDHEYQIQSARAHYQRAQAIASRLDDDPDRGRTRKRLQSFALSRLADANKLENRHAPALEQYREMLSLREDLHAAHADRVSRADLAVAHLKIGDGYCRFFEAARNTDSLTRADAHYIKSHQLYQALAQEFPGDIEYARMFGHAWDRLADVRLHRREWVRSIEACLAAMNFRRGASQRFPGCKLAFEIENCYSLDRLAIACLSSGQFYRAQKAAEETLQLRLDLVKRNPRSIWFKHGLAVSYNHLAESWRSQTRYDLALANYEKSYHLEKETEAASPSAPETLNAVREALDGLIQTSYLIPTADDLTIRYSEERFAIRRKLIASNPGDRYDRSCYFYELQALGDFHLLRGRHTDAACLYQEAGRFSEEAREMGWTADDLENLHKRQELCARAKRPGFSPCAELLQLPIGPPDFLIRMQQEFHAQKDHAHLAQVSERIAGQRDNMTCLCAAARGFAQAAVLAPPGKEQQTYDQRCEELLIKLLELGGEVPERLRQDPVFTRYERVKTIKN